MKKSTLVVILLVFLSIFSLSPIKAEAKSENYKSQILDESGILGKDENEVLESLIEAEDRTDITFLVAIYDSSYIPSGIEIIRILGFDTGDDIVLLVIEKGKTNYFEMFTYGIANTVVTQNKVDTILDSDEVHKNIKSGNFSSGIISFASQTTGAIKSYRATLVVVIILISAFAGAIGVGIVIFTYKKKLKSAIYPLSNYANLSLTEKSDIFLGKTVTRVRINSDNGGGHKGGGGHGGGGGSRGRR